MNTTEAITFWAIVTQKGPVPIYFVRFFGGCKQYEFDANLAMRFQTEEEADQYRSENGFSDKWETQEHQLVG